MRALSLESWLIMEGAHVRNWRACGLARQAQSRSCGVCHDDVLGHDAAIFEVDHWSPPLWKIASSFFDSTSNAAVSASAVLAKQIALQLLVRFLSARVACGLARASSGSGSAAAQLARHLSNSPEYTPCLRHQALLPASSSAAVVTTASSRAAAVQARRRAGLDCASSRHRSSVAVLSPTSRTTTFTAAPSGGNNLATALSLNACPYRVTSVLHRRALGFWFYRGDNYSDAGGCPPAQPSGRPGTVPPQDRTRTREGQCSPGAS
jgi:hypothetical protein